MISVQARPEASVRINMIDSETTKSNKRVFTGEYTDITGRYKVEATVRWDDKCGNGHNTFAITGRVWDVAHPEWGVGGCVHEGIAKAIPELAPFIKWHLFDPFGPMHYIANTVYHAGDRDYNGLKAGEKQHIRNGRTNQLCWILEPTTELEKYVDSDEYPTETATLRYVPWYRVGLGKARDLQAARNTAVWPEATDAELCQEPAELTKALEARLPKLIARFKKDLGKLGFEW